MQHVDADHRLEHLAGHVVGGADAARRHVDLARIGLGIGDELRAVLAWNVGLTTTTKALRLKLATGAISRMKLKRRLS